MRLPHFHWFRKTGINTNHAIVGRYPLRKCRCGLYEARVLGGWGYGTRSTGPFYDRPFMPGVER